MGHVAAGQRVSVMPLLFCGTCYYCRRGLTTCASRWPASASATPGAASPSSPSSPPARDRAAGRRSPTCRARWSSRPRWRPTASTSRSVRPGDTVLVTGAGPIGALASLYAASLGARVVVSEVNPTRADLARSLDVGDVRRPDAGRRRRLDARTGPRASAPTPSSSARATSGPCRRRSTPSARPAGSRRPACTPGPPSIEPMKLSEHDITLAGTWCYPVTDWPRIIDLIARGRLPVEKVVTAQVPMADVVEQRLRGAAVAHRRPGQGAHRRAAAERRDEGAAVRRARAGPRSPSCRCRTIADDEVLVAARVGRGLPLRHRPARGPLHHPVLLPAHPGPRVVRRGRAGRAARSPVWRPATGWWGSA